MKEIVETESEVIVTGNGSPLYKLTLDTPATSRKTITTKDYMARLRRHQPRPISATAAKALEDENRGTTCVHNKCAPQVG